MPRPVHFEIQAADPKRAIAFYTALFGWTFNKWEGPQDYWLIKTGEKGTMGIDGGLLPRRGPPPVPMQATLIRSFGPVRFGRPAAWSSSAAMASCANHAGSVATEALASERIRKSRRDMSLSFTVSS